MPLRRLVIENVRSIEHVEIDFGPADATRRWTVLLGENGTGKTTILRAAAIALAGSNALPELLKDPGSWVRNKKRVARICAEYSTKDGEPRTARVEWASSDKIADVLLKNAKNLDALNSAIDHAQRNYFVAGYGSSRRLPSKISGSFSEREMFDSLRAKAVGTLFSRDAALKPLDSWAMYLDYSKREGLKVVREALNRLLPGVKFHRIDKARQEILFRTPDGIVPLDRLSDGYQNMASWIGDLLFRLTATFADYKRPLSAGGLLLLDEVDLHLHPAWQRKLLAYLDERLPNFQFIVSTHSPFTAHQAETGALHILERKGNAAPTLRQYAGDTRLLRVDQILDGVMGLETTDSLATEELRAEYMRLRDNPKRDAKRFEELKRELSERPAAQLHTFSKQDQKQFALLSRLEKILEKRA